MSSGAVRCDYRIDLFTSDQSIGLVQAHTRCIIESVILVFPCWRFTSPATVVSDVLLEGSVSVRKRGKQTRLFSQNYTVDFECLCFVCSLVVCYVFFCLTYLPFRIDFRKGWFFSLLVCVFVVFYPIQNYPGDGLPLPFVHRNQP